MSECRSSAGLVILAAGVSRRKRYRKKREIENQKSARCERSNKGREGDGSEERLFTDKRADTWPQSAGRW